MRYTGVWVFWSTSHEPLCLFSLVLPLTSEINFNDNWGRLNTSRLAQGEWKLCLKMQPGEETRLQTNLFAESGVLIKVARCTSISIINIDCLCRLLYQTVSGSSWWGNPGGELSSSLVLAWKLRKYCLSELQHSLAATIHFILRSLSVFLQ